MSTQHEKLPHGWAPCQVADFARLIRGITYSKDQASKAPAHGVVPLLRANNINGTLNFDDLVYVPQGLVEIEQLIKAGDIIFAMSSGSLHLVGKSAQAKKDFGGSCGAFCAILRVNPNVSDRFAAFAFQSNEFRRKISETAKGSNINNLKREHILGHFLALPPLAEQRRIVAKIEELFSELDKGIENLKQARAQLAVYRQALLKHAFEGKLTAAWRKANTHTLEPAPQLLARIHNERRQNWRRPGKYKEATALVANNLPSLPETWTWVSWDTVLANEEGAFKRGPFGSALTKSIFVPKGFKVYEQYCPINDDCSFGRYYITPEKFEELQSFEVKAGDYLISCSGVTLGRITRVPEDFERGIINQALLRVRINESVIDHRYFLQFFRSHIFQKAIFDNSTGSAIPNIKGVKEMKALPIPLPNVAEQRQIVLELDAQMSAIASLESDIDTNLQKAEALRQSILKKAFAGELVPQDPADEPASALLARIRAERAAANQETKPKKSSPREKANL